jgi:hypothetical protein
VNKKDVISFTKQLESFLEDYIFYVNTYDMDTNWYEKQNSLQRRTPLIAKIVTEVTDNSSYIINNNTYSFHHVLASTLQDRADEKKYYDETKALVIMMINESIGNIENDTIPSKDIKPRLPILDDILCARCLKLIDSGVPFDIVIREATLVFEVLKMARGIFAYWRNPFHHKLNDKTELTLAWSVVGVIDSILAEINASSVVAPKIIVPSKKESV